VQLQGQDIGGYFMKACNAIIAPVLSEV